MAEEMAVSLELVPSHTVVKTWPAEFDPTVQFGQETVSMQEFCEAVEYVLTNSDLESDDPRLALVRKIQRSRIGPGHNNGKTRISF